MAQADAWLAICALSKNLDSDYETAPRFGLVRSVARKSGAIFWTELARHAQCAEQQSPRLGF